LNRHATSPLSMMVFFFHCLFLSPPHLPPMPPFSAELSPQVPGHRPCSPGLIALDAPSLLDGSTFVRFKEPRKPPNKCHISKVPPSLNWKLSFRLSYLLGHLGHSTFTPPVLSYAHLNYCRVPFSGCNGIPRYQRRQVIQTKKNRKPWTRVHTRTFVLPLPSDACFR